VPDHTGAVVLAHPSPRRSPVRRMGRRWQRAASAARLLTVAEYSASSAA